VKRTQEELVSLDANIKDIKNEAKKIEKEKEGFKAITEKIDKLNSIMGEAEGKIEQLTNRMSLINRTEKRLNDLSIMADDIKVKIKALSDEEKVIARAGEQIAELRFLLGEVERKIGELNIKGRDNE
ncbi:MAG: hypothetical protein HY578_08950, partial [Nitrospinae bacterium]|nr:hypothetical protein [Nitrospinota bacterium]